ncbi:UNVERIFIED_ORG: hypothetical protein LHK14_24120 (plasmid) [Roseateles sp. XES5]|nr:hypothetical protein [Roseateles sp. XES5]
MKSGSDHLGKRPKQRARKEDFTGWSPPTYPLSISLFSLWGKPQNQVVFRLGTSNRPEDEKQAHFRKPELGMICDHCVIGGGIVGLATIMRLLEIVRFCSRWLPGFMTMQTWRTADVQQISS